MSSYSKQTNFMSIEIRSIFINETLYLNILDCFITKMNKGDSLYLMVLYTFMCFNIYYFAYYSPSLLN